MILWKARLLLHCSYTKFQQPQSNIVERAEPVAIPVPTLNFIHIAALLSLSLYLPSVSLSKNIPPPLLPILPIPTSFQLSWQLTQMALFIHFGPNTFTDSEWGNGTTDPSIFFPSNLDAKQWVQVAKSTGFSRIILTMKHHDGFCLWPSNYTNYSVASSPWKDGFGDVVAELAEAAKEAGIQLGLYLSPWDRHESCYGKTEEYNEFYLGQMTELLTRYGAINEVWLDGAKGEGEKDMEYFFDTWFALIHQLQPEAVIFSDAGPDARWIGDEAGVAGVTCWSLFNRTDAKIGDTDPGYSLRGDPNGHDWVPAECDVSIRPGWFWHANEVPKTASTLLDIYYKSAGRNCLLLLNVPPNSSGLISDADIQVLEEFAELRRSIFSHNLARNAIVTASSTRASQYAAGNVLEDGIYTYWAPEEHQLFGRGWILFIDLGNVTRFNVLQIQEPIHMGQRISEFHLDIRNDQLGGQWQKVGNGTTVGYKRLFQFPEQECQYLRVVIDKSRADPPLVSYIGVYMDSHSETSPRLELNGSRQIIQHTINNHLQKADS